MGSEEYVNQRRGINPNVINAVVLFIANQSKQNSGAATSNISDKDSMEIFKAMIYRLDDPTRKAFLNSIVNELRYPNNHTYYFSCIVLFLFVESNNESIQECIARILFERLQVHRPHPWGLMITFRELLMNPQYNFMQKDFVVKNKAHIDDLFKTRLRPFQQFIAGYKQS